MVKLGVGCGICGFLLYKYDFREVFRSARLIDASAMFWIWFWMLLGLWCHSMMLQRALRPLGMPFATRDIYKINFQIRFYGLFLPGAANVLVKWYKLARPGRQPAQALAIMVFTRFLHTFAMLALSLVGMCCDARFPWPNVRWFALIALAVTTGCVLLFVSESIGAPLAKAFTDAAQRLPLSPGIRARFEKILTLSAQLRQITLGQLAFLLALSIVGQLFQTFSHFVIAHSIGMDVTVWIQMWVRGVILLCAIVPISLSGLGIREASIVAVFVYYGIPQPMALAYSLTFFALTVAIGLIGGALELKDHLMPPRPRDSEKVE
jgi:hypothetical protein